MISEDEWWRDFKGYKGYSGVYDLGKKAEPKREWVKPKPCHKDGKFYRQVDGIGARLYLSGSSYEKAGWVKRNPKGVLLTLASRYGFIFSNTGYQSGEFAEVNIDWPDYGVLEVDWPSLKAELNRFDSVLISCMGGHGRTGTVAVLLGYQHGVSAPNAIKDIRARYCRKAVESQKQIDLIESLLGEQTDRKEGKERFGGYGVGKGLGLTDDWLKQPDHGGMVLKKESNAGSAFHGLVQIGERWYLDGKEVNL